MRRAALLVLLLRSPATADEPRPLPLRDRVPEGATLFLVWSADLDGLEEIRVRGKEVTVKHLKLGRPKDVQTKVVARLPRRELGVFARLVKGRGRVQVFQDPSRKNGYEAVARVSDKGKGSAPAVVELYYGPRPPPPPPFPVAVPEGPAPEWNRRALQPGRFFGERDGPVRELAKGHPFLTWRGRVREYAVLAVSADGIELLDCGLGGAETAGSSVNGTLPSTHYLVLTKCEGPGRVRVVQRMRVAGEPRTFIELDGGAYSLVGHAVPRADVDRLHGNDRLWKIETACMTRAYPGPAPNPIEVLTLLGLSKQERVVDLRGHNVILAWPQEYLARIPTKWRFLAEMDAALDWLAEWTGKDQVKSRRKRLISRFRVDNSGTALYVDFRLHIPRKEMRFPPNHGPYSHEASHGYIGFESICPTGRYNEGLTEVSRIAYWWCLGIDDAWRPFRQRCLASLKKHYENAGTLGDVGGYGTAAAVYLALHDRFCQDDWRRFGKFLENARASKGKGFDSLVAVAERTFGPDARKLLETLRIP